MCMYIRYCIAGYFCSHKFLIIIKSLTNREEFVKQLEDSYAADTDTVSV